MSKLIVPSPPPQQPGLVFESPCLPSERASTCSLSRPLHEGRPKAHSCAKRSANELQTCSSSSSQQQPVHRPARPSLAQVACTCTRYAPSTSLSPDQLGTQPQTGNCLAASLHSWARQLDGLHSIS
ncbi:hypothetical protein B5807_03409 [Epicoccum nigrum]|uniref:Uncharacterized protein n=1 Tax=Epicoccum nigrum TaxID=105696 RepID=A0A1Y2M7P3_EPING|nr:hypothetical protein B5807_03409 [Epicoccum nigrum]